MGYSEPKKVICRSTGVVVGTLQSDNIKINGKPCVVYFDSRVSHTITLGKVVFDVKFRLEDCR
jgi:hypothetical protein